MARSRPTGDPRNGSAGEVLRLLRALDVEPDDLRRRDLAASAEVKETASDPSAF